jgi:hypothetical protein
MVHVGEEVGTELPEPTVMNKVSREIKLPWSHGLFVLFAQQTSLTSENNGGVYTFFLVQTGSGAHPASCPMGTGGPFAGGKARTGREADHSPPSSAEVVNEGTIFPLPSSASMACSGTALLNMHLFLTAYMLIFAKNGILFHFPRAVGV